MHIVHIKEEHNNLSQAEKDRTGVAVLGFLFEVILFDYCAIKKDDRVERLDGNRCNICCSAIASFL